ncbi:hypothetical protein XAC3810_660031 [Xanthomonas citri pv. citri]|uniref:Uncharacterized protein n=1 Tax=Xanthomonas citri pv. citri TaxID=611301 RepID=A0A0U5BXN2_XANCI|nr:hypothetical protein XAC9322_630005 [Xanthomonas citri pv. citri]CEE35774.1 hypothetical protein XAC3824_820058 [Xanthomonas citri pv. citri]CEE36728.1 hypothetical protein XAC1083_650031 [Xanthomonas citri pv. citri]CEE45644.1 hypothetical protein XAC3810_660031 [Xanthomonas citri pv. citri]CEE46646.1 hypothetical protein XAC902_970032 [Xanthomonas citri pv. citri]
MPDGEQRGGRAAQPRQRAILMGMIHILNSRIGIYLVPLDPSERYLRWKRIFATPGPTAAIAAELA